MLNPNHYVFGAIRVISESKDIYVLSRRKSAPAIFYPKDRDDYYALRGDISKSRETLTGAKALTRIMFEETLKAVKQGKNFTYVMTLQGLNFYLDLYQKCFGKEKLSNYIKELPNYLLEHRHKVFVVDESNPLSMYASEQRMILVLTESRGEIAGIHTNQNHIVQLYLQLFKEILNRSQPLEYYLDRYVK